MAGDEVRRRRCERLSARNLRGPARALHRHRDRRPERRYSPAQNLALAAKQLAMMEPTDGQSQ